MINRLKAGLNSILTKDSGRFKFMINLPVIISWLFVLPIAILSYFVVKLIIMLMIFVIIIIIPAISSDIAYWIGFIMVSMLGQVIGTFSFCFYGSAMAPNYNNIACLVLGIILGLLFMIPLFMGYLTITFILPYLCCLIGVTAAIVYRKRTYQVT